MLTQKETQLGEFQALEIESEQFRLTLLPAMGAKVISLIDKSSGYDYLWHNPQRPYRRPAFGDLYTDYDVSGWDECFPTIAEAPYPDGAWRGILAADHGEVWTLPWETCEVLKTSQVCMWTEGIRFPYRFERRMDFSQAGQIALTYTAHNRAPFPFKCFWSMHPSFAVTPATRILLPAETRYRVEISTDERVGSFLSEHPWPVVADRHGKEIDLSIMGPADQGYMEKLFSTRLAQGWGAFYDPESDQYLAFTFSPEEVPFIGVCTNRGAFPLGAGKWFDLMFEPCTGWPDRLDLAATRGACMVIPPRGELRWTVNVHLGRGSQALAGIIGRHP